MNYTEIIAKALNLEIRNVSNTIKLLEEGATIPFISRYRKEMTGSMDEEILGYVKDEYRRLQELDKRRETILNSIKEQGKLSEDLKARIGQAQTSTELEDLYLPYKPKKKTRATIARDKGLEPLAGIIMKQQEYDVNKRAEQFLNDKVGTIEDALQGARDIIAEWICENNRARNAVRRLFSHEAVISSRLVKGKEEEAAKYKDYFEFSEPLKKCPSHRMLAMRRGEDEGFLKLTIAPDLDKAIEILENQFIKGYLDISEQVRIAIKDSYKRLLAPSIETEFRSGSKEAADEVAIGVFSKNLRQLLMSPPLGNKRILALDPGYRTGCKVVCIEEDGFATRPTRLCRHHPPVYQTCLKEVLGSY